MKYSTVTSKGRLRKSLLPAVYLDASVIIDYWIADGIEHPESDSEYQNAMLQNEVHRLVREIVDSEKRIRKVAHIRSNYLDDRSKISFVTSELAVWELQDWLAESGFRRIATEACGSSVTKKMGKKEIGKSLRKALDLYEKEEEHHNPEEGVTALTMLMMDMWTNLSYAQAHGLRGITVVDIVNFNLPPKRSIEIKLFPNPLTLSYLQIGAADIFHLMFAHHLGCSYFATFDKGLEVAKGQLEEAGITLLTTPEQINKVM